MRTPHAISHTHNPYHQTVDAPSAEQQASLWPIADRVRADTPVLHQTVHDRPLVYLDSAATSQKPRAVLDSMREYYEQYNSNVHRGVHSLSARATDAYEAARLKVARFINAKTDREIVFTRNASEAINLVAYSWGMHTLKAGDEIVLSVAEHHSNLVPWQLVAERTGAVLKHVGLTEQQELDMDVSVAGAGAGAGRLHGSPPAAAAAAASAAAAVASSSAFWPPQQPPLTQ